MTEEITKFKTEYFASCPTGLEPLLESELIHFEAKNTKVVKGGVHFENAPELVIKSIIYSRIASRIYKKLYHFNVKKEKDIYIEAKKIKWKSIFNLEQTFKIQVVQGKSPDGTKRSQFKNSMYLAQQLKDAIVDRFRDDCDGVRPDVDKQVPDAGFLMRVEPNNNPHSQKEEVTILIDLCGVALSNRSYRVKSFAAPLRENLAAGILMLAGYDGTQTLVDGMCGSGTFLAEAALIKGNIPPSYLYFYDLSEHGDELPWSFLRLNFYTKDQYLIEKTEKFIKQCTLDIEAGFKKLADNKIDIFGYDIEKYSLEVTEHNSRIARIFEYIKLEKADTTKISPPDAKPGIFVANPPYGERLGEEEALKKLYYQLGENLKKNFNGYNAYILTGNLSLLKKISLRTSKKHILWNGNIEARLAKYDLY